MATADARIAAYYDYTLPYYDNFWHGYTNAVHYGFSDATTLGHEDELLNTNRFLARVAEVRRGERVLDAGCGIGGSALWLAQQLGASVVGVTLSARQVRRARSLARRHRVEDRVHFHQCNLLATGFATGTFDVAWALESTCYLAHSAELLRELRRLLRPGGRLVLADGFMLRAAATPWEERWFREFVDGLLLPGLTPFAAVAPRLEAAGFTAIRTWDQTRAIRASARRLARRCRAGYPLALVGERLRLVDPLLTRNHRAGIAQYELVKRGIAGYGVFVATNPG